MDKIGRFSSRAGNTSTVESRRGSHSRRQRDLHGDKSLSQRSVSSGTQRCLLSRRGSCASTRWREHSRNCSVRRPIDAIWNTWIGKALYFLRLAIEKGWNPQRCLDSSARHRKISVIALDQRLLVVGHQTGYRQRHDRSQSSRR